MLRRREFLKASTVAAAAALPATAAGDNPVRVGIIGNGNRGSSLLGRVLRIDWAHVTALCDVRPEASAKSQDLLQSAGRPKAQTYTGSTEAYKRLLDRKDVDVVIIATPWDLHTPMAWKPMADPKNGKDQLAAGHGGTDPLMIYKFFEAVRNRTPLPLSFEDGLLMSVVVPLSAQSIAGNAKAIDFPDFTRGAWKTNKPYFALDRKA
ncbi:MAG: Gfo/Idh/MocA family oxidoreductase [Bryobacterales bacterium]|nr:Gfo/Idh/MocA family oxidoreductase [Bryobacterales bacterium]